MDKEYAGKVWAVYRNETDPRATWGISGTVISLFDSLRGAQKYIEARKRNDELRGQTGNYSIVPWLVQK